MKFIDTHCHPYLNKIKNASLIIKHFFEGDGEALIIIGTDKKTSVEALNLTKKHDKIYATIGVHPSDVYDLKLNETIEFLEKLYIENKEKIVGIGECGLDYYRIFREAEDLPEGQREENIKEKKQKQKEFFIGQIALAKKFNLPIVIHNREAKDDILEILKQEDFKDFIFHCYSEDLDFALKLLEFSPNCKIGFSGVVTFKNAKEIQETAKNIPLKNILAETDSPFLTPVPYRGKEENEPVFTKFVVEEIAKLREEDLEEVAKQILTNSKEIFNI